VFILHCTSRLSAVQLCSAHVRGGGCESPVIAQRRYSRDLTERNTQCTYNAKFVPASNNWQLVTSGLPAYATVQNPDGAIHYYVLNTATGLWAHISSMIASNYCTMLADLLNRGLVDRQLLLDKLCLFIYSTFDAVGALGDADWNLSLFGALAAEARAFDQAMPAVVPENADAARGL
jgi:hypothetical protein